MAYIVGLLTIDEEQELVRRGWVMERAPDALIDEETGAEPERMKMVWVDSSMFTVMSGADWDKGDK